MEPTTNVTDIGREESHRLWWSLCVFDRTISVLTGYPTITGGKKYYNLSRISIDEDLLSNYETNTFSPSSSVSKDQSDSLGNEFPPSNLYAGGDSQPSTARGVPDLPKPSNDPGSNLATYFNLNINLHHMIEEMVLSLQGLSVHGRVDTSSLALVFTFNAVLERWRSMLPKEFNFVLNDKEDMYKREKNSLGFTFYAAKIAINRIGLNPRYPSKNPMPSQPDYNAGTICVQAAQDMLDLIPSASTSETLYRQVPWWCVVHHLMEAISVLIQELSLQCSHAPDSKEAIFKSAKKATLWLHSISTHDEGALHAWRYANKLICLVAPGIGKDVSDLPSEPPISESRSRYSSELTGDFQENEPFVATSLSYERMLPFQAQTSFPAPIYIPYAAYDDIGNTFEDSHDISRMDTYPALSIQDPGMQYQYHQN